MVRPNPAVVKQRNKTTSPYFQFMGKHLNSCWYYDTNNLFLCLKFAINLKALLYAIPFVLKMEAIILVLICRDHAVISYDHGQRTFFLQDVGSSNGSFVNNIRLSKAGQESRITRIYSGDVIRLILIIFQLTLNSRAPCRTLIGRGVGGVQRLPPLSQFLLKLEG